MLYPPLTPLRYGVFYFPQVDSCPAQQPEGHYFLGYLVLSCNGNYVQNGFLVILCVSGVYHQCRIRFRVSRVLSEKFSKYVYMYILIQSGDIYGYGEGDDSQIRVAPPRNNTHTKRFIMVFTFLVTVN